MCSADGLLIVEFGKFQSPYVSVSDTGPMLPAKLAKKSFSFHGPTFVSSWWLLMLFQMPVTNATFFTGPTSPSGNTSPPTGWNTTP
ncbi:MAG: hypothetical protein JWO31_728 [Phycisphaerales bacterium]|nr:hypothetical protein [Phycisphaerales bacterium]